MADKPKAFRWLGFHSENDIGARLGVLHIQRADGTRKVIAVGKIVKEAEDLAALGAERIEELVKAGKAEFMSLLEKLGVEELLGRENPKSDLSPDEQKKAEEAAQSASDATRADANLQGLMSQRGHPLADPAAPAMTQQTAGSSTAPQSDPASGGAGPKE